MSFRNRSVRIVLIVVLIAAALVVTGTSALAQRSQDRNNSAAPAAIDPVLQAALKNAPTAAQWPNSDYAQILDLCTMTVKPDGTVVSECRETYKLFNERARRIAEVSLPYNSSYQEMKVLRARTIKKNGAVQEVRPQDIRITAPFSDFPLYDESVAASFSMPGIEDDCIIDYSYRQITRPIYMPGQFWEYWGFSNTNPVGVSRLTLRIPANKPLQFRVYNNDSLQPTVKTSADGRTRIYNWEMSNIPPIEPEPDMPDQREIQVWMELSSLNSWQDVARWFWELAKPQMTASSAIRSEVGKLIAGKKTDEEKARAIYDFAANRVRYVGLEFGISAFKPHAARQIYENLYGDCKDKAILLVTMLNLAGIKAHPVLLHTEDHRPLSGQLPVPGSCNHCIALAEVGGKEVWLDATAETCAYGDIPEADRGAEALVVRNGAGRFQTIPLYRPEENGFDATMSVLLRPDGSADIQAEVKARGAIAQGMRSAIRSLTPDQRKQMMQGLAQGFSVGAKLKDFQLPDGTDKIGPYVLKMTLAAPERARKTRSFLLVPISEGTDSFARRNPYVKEARAWPIVIEQSDLSRSEVTIALPEGYAAEEIPSDLDLNGPLSEYHRRIVPSADGKSVTVTVTTITKPIRVPPGEYAKVRAFYDAMLKAGNDLIILRKVK
jgi:hypothetical protein